MWAAKSAEVGNCVGYLGRLSSVFMIPAMPRAVPDPPPGQCDRVGAMIDELLDDPRSPALVAEYYDPAKNFVGMTFLDLAPNDPFAFGPSDLYAVTLLLPKRYLGVSIARRLLPGGDLAVHASALLARIPVGVPIWDATERDLEWAYELWLLLCSIDRVGSTAAGKLLARKRPECIPIIDRVLRTRLACEQDTYWKTFRCILQDPARRAKISALAPHIPELRVLDTLMWMHWRQPNN